MIAAINEFERASLLERQAEGVKLCKERNGYKKKDVDMDLFKQLEQEVQEGKISVATAASALNISR